MTRDVKMWSSTTSVENVAGVNYNLSVSTARISGHFLLAMICAPLLAGAACEKKKTTTDTGAVSALDRANAGNATVNDTTPLAGIDLEKLDADKQKLFYRLVNSLKSPCGKTHSLRTSFTSDTSCRRAPYAVKYVLAVIEDEGTEEQVRKEYEHKYASTGRPVKLDVSKAPREGKIDAPVRLVEFFDYACPHCQQFKPMLDQVVQEHGGKVVEYFLMYPLGKWPDSKSAAQAALAASQQGKFKEMHATLFARSPIHSKAAVMGYAKELGLDLAKFEADYDAAAAQVENDRAQGEAAEVESTPTLFFNDRKYEGPLNPKYIGMWIEEEVAVNR